MKTKSEQKKNVNVNADIVEKKENNSSCCGPTCCSGANKKESNRKDK